MRPKHRASGQSLVETLVVCLALVPLVYLGVWLGRVADIQLATGNAARLLAFDCVYRFQQCQDLTASPDLVERVRVHAMSNDRREVLSMDQLENTPSIHQSKPLWEHRGQHLLEKFSDVAGANQKESFDGPAGIIAGRNNTAVVDVTEHLSNLAGPGRFGLAIYDGFQKSFVQATLSPSAPSLTQGQRLDVIPLQLTRHVALLSDGWTSTGAKNGRADSTAVRVAQGQQLPIASAALEQLLRASYSGTRAAMRLAQGLGLEDQGDQFNWHEIDVTVLPNTRRSTVTSSGQGETVPPQIPEFGP